MSNTPSEVILVVRPHDTQDKLTILLPSEPSLANAKWQATLLADSHGVSANTIVDSGTVPDKYSSIELNTGTLPHGTYDVMISFKDASTHKVLACGPAKLNVSSPRSDSIQRISDRLDNILRVSGQEKTETKDEPLWESIRLAAANRSFKKFCDFISQCLCATRTAASDVNLCEEFRDRWNFSYKLQASQSFERLKAATDLFVLLHCNTKKSKAEDDGSANDAGGKKLLEYLGTSDELPYIKRIAGELALDLTSDVFYPFCDGYVNKDWCFYELIWSYWHEEGMLVQTINAIASRFQNRDVDKNRRNPLATFEITPLRGINNLLWGYVDDTKSRLTARRRAYEYEHEYGLSLRGEAIGKLTPADRRSKFLEVFHVLLNRCSQFYRDRANVMINPDPFPLLSAIKDVHLVLAEGAHNQFGDLPTTARSEMLIQQFLLAQPPLREFLHSRASVPYAEPWMGQVDAMKQIMGWSDVSVSHYNELAVKGEQLLLSLRYGDWAALEMNADNARNWALFWQPEVQSYIASYRAVTGADLGIGVSAPKVDATPPSVLIGRRVAQQQRPLGRTR